MPPQPTVTQIRLNSVTKCLTITAKTLEILSSSINSPFLAAMSKTTQSLLKNMQLSQSPQTVRQSKTDCTQLMEQIYVLLNAVLMAYTKLDSSGELPLRPSIKSIHLLKPNRNGSKVRRFFRQGEMSMLLKECKMELQQGLDMFQINTITLTQAITEMQEAAEKRHAEVVDMIEALSDTASSDRASTISRAYSDAHSSSNSISLLPSEPKIFHGREAEISGILRLFTEGTPRIAILATQMDLAALIGTHVGLKPGKDLVRPVIQYFTMAPHSLLILDNIETLWEPTESRSNIEELLSQLTGCQTTFAYALNSEKLDHDARSRKAGQARQTFIDIADSIHDAEEVDKFLSLTDNMLLAITLMAHLVDSADCSNVSCHWKEEKTSLISEGYDRRSNLDLSISLSLSSPRLNSFPQSKDLLSLQSMLPDGLSDVELVQSNLPIDDILGCKTTLIRTSLAYSDERKRLKLLVPIREYMQKIKPPGDHLVRPLFKHFQELLEFWMEYHGTQSSSSTVTQVTLNYSNIHSVLQNGLKKGHPDLKDSIYSTCYLNRFSRHIKGPIALMGQIRKILPRPCDHRLEVYVIMELFNSSISYRVSNPEELVSEALSHLEQFEDPDLKCRFYDILAYHYQLKHDISTAQKYCEIGISLALSTGNTKIHSQILCSLAWVKWALGDYPTAQLHAHESQRLARHCTDLHREAEALRIEAICSYKLGNHRESISICNRARALLDLCGLSESDLNHDIMNTQGEIHKCKSEYSDARNINTKVQGNSEESPYVYGFSLLNLAEIDVAMGAPQANVQSNCDTAREIFNTMGLTMEVTMCNIALADLHLREGNTLEAKAIFERSIKLTWGHPQIMSYCLERLGDASCWDLCDRISTWTTVFLVHSLKVKDKVRVHKALRYLGDTFLAQNDEQTAISLLTVALEAFTYMDVHRSRAECMLRLGDIYEGQGNLLNAVKLWTTARPLFQRSSQTKQVEKVDKRLSSVSQDVLEQHTTSVGRLGEPGTCDTLGNLSEIRDMERLHSDDE
ncbi:hypothetical protein B0H13DRAFT_1872316 [Mycena leptocephala]|nr:hypothetical protein B0H13DRAFT_1872316 [Mycena leptocephala]